MAVSQVAAKALVALVAAKARIVAVEPSTRVEVWLLTAAPVALAQLVAVTQGAPDA